MTRYAKYKPTGIAWLPEVPEGWEVRPLKTCFVSSFSGVWGQDVQPNLDAAVCYRVADFDYQRGVLRDSKLTVRGYSSRELDGKLIKRGDLLLEKSGGGDLSPVGRMIWVNRDEKATCSNFIQQFRCNDVNSGSYVCYAFRYLYARKINGYYYNQTIGIQNLKVARYISLNFPLPPLAEQKAIAAYLDDKCSKVDRLVEAKTKQIELFKELRERVIADAVTKGIDGCKTFKPTNIPWLPEVPETWEVVRNKCFMVLTDEKVGDRKGQFPLLSLTKQGVIIRDISTGKGKFPKDYDTYLVVKPNNLVFCLFDIEETPRTVGLVRNIGMITGAYTNFEINTNMVLPEFVYYYYLFVDEGKRLSPYYTGLRKVVKTNTFLSLRFPLPPLSEQKRIVTYLGKKCAKIDALVAKIEDEVVKLKEYRERLVADVVTGQRKVVK